MDLNKVLNQVIQLSKEAGEFIQTEGKSFDLSKVEYKGHNNLVSYVDKETERMLIQSLKKILPGSGFIAEEGTENVIKEQYNWIIDPLDGTTNFTHGLPVYSISIALVEQNSASPDDVKTILGVVHDPNRDECFHALSDGKSYCNETEIRVSDNPNLQESLMATGFPYFDFEKLARYMELLKNFMPKTHGFRRMGSAAIDLVYVACGRFDGFFEYNLNPWDVAAGALIVQRAGGLVTDFKGTENFLFGKEILAGNKLQPEMLKLVQDFWAK